MPFEQVFPRSLIADSIQAYAPRTSGVYGISNAQEWVFIDEADDICNALLAHVNQPDSTVMRHHPTGFVFEICDRARRSARKLRLILEYDPGCNRRSTSSQRKRR